MARGRRISLLNSIDRTHWPFACTATYAVEHAHGSDGRFAPAAHSHVGWVSLAGAWATIERVIQRKGWL